MVANVKITETALVPNRSGAQVSITIEVPAPASMPRHEAEAQTAILFAPYAQNLARIFSNMMVPLMSNQSDGFLRSQDIMHEKLESANKEIVQLIEDLAA